MSPSKQRYAARGRRQRADADGGGANAALTRAARPAIVTLAAAVLLGGCAARIGSGDPRFGASSTALGDFSVPVASMRARSFANVVHQQYDFSCGSAALATLLHYHYGLPRTETDVFTGMWAKGDQAQIRRVGFSLLDMKRYLGEQGLAADGYKVTLDAIAGRRLPGIALVTIRGYRHFVVVKGVTPTTVLVGDPSLGLRAIRRDQFQQVWNGIYFVLNSAPETGTASFNAPTQWRTIARAPVGAPFVDPISQQALSLSAPFYRDF